MFRKMRRFKQQMSDEEAQLILKNGSSGVLALLGDDDYPYAVPLSYVYTGDKIIFHGAKSGHKFDAVKKHPKASFCVIGKDHVIPEEYTTYYKSVIVFGKMRIIEDEEEILETVRTLALKYRSEDDEILEKAIKRELAPLCMFCLDIEHVTGKMANELTK